MIIDARLRGEPSVDGDPEPKPSTGLWLRYRCQTVVLPLHSRLSPFAKIQGTLSKDQRLARACMSGVSKANIVTSFSSCYCAFSNIPGRFAILVAFPESWLAASALSM